MIKILLMHKLRIQENRRFWNFFFQLNNFTVGIICGILLLVCFFIAGKKKKNELHDQDPLLIISYQHVRNSVT